MANILSAQAIHVAQEIVLIVTGQEIVADEIGEIVQEATGGRGSVSVQNDDPCIL